MDLNGASDTKICTGCGYVITSKYLSLNGEDWHSTCVLCDECEGPVYTDESSRLHTQEGKIYCKDCVTQLFQVCADCGQPAKKYVKALGKIWHTFHFKCSSCKCILDAYAEVDGEAYCQPCHQRLSAKSFTKAKRRSFGTEKREAAAKAAAKPAWATKRAPSTAPKSALDVMHKSWFINGLKKPAASPTSSPSASPTLSSSNPSVPAPAPSSPTMSSRVGPQYSGNSSPQMNSSGYRSNSPNPPQPGYSPLSPLSPQLQPTIKPRANVPPVSVPQQPNGQKSGSPSSSGSWTRSTAGGSTTPPVDSADANKPKPPWANQPAAPAAKQQPATQLSKSSSKVSPAPTTSGSGGFTRAQPNGAAPAQGYTSINFEQSNSPVTMGGTRKSFRQQAPVEIPEGMNIGDILEAVLRPLSEDEVGSLAFQAIPLLAQVHSQGRLHNNITHKTLRVTKDGVVLLLDKVDGEPDDETKIGAIKFRAPEPGGATIQSDTYSLGVALWTSTDYLLDEEEEPELSAEFCDFIGLMTDDEPNKRPPLRTLLPYVEKYRDVSMPILCNLLREVERKKILRLEIQETTVQRQKALGKELLNEINKGVRLKRMEKAAVAPVQRPPNPHELMCLCIKNFRISSLKRVDYSKLPVKQYKLNPRERLMQSISEGACLRKAVVLAGYDINLLICPVPNHPTYGTIFRDVSSLFTIPKVANYIAQQICNRYSGEPPDLFVATPTDGGVVFASLAAQIYNRGVVVLQNTGRLPRKMEKHSCPYDTLGYVSHQLELQLPKGLIREGTRVVLVDEMLVSGGILEAARQILRETGAKLKEILCIAELEGFGGRAKVRNFECNVHSMYTFNDNASQPR